MKEKSFTQNVLFASLINRTKGRTGRKHAGKIIHLMTDSEKGMRESIEENYRKDSNFIETLVIKEPKERERVWREKLNHHLPDDWPRLYPRNLPAPVYEKLRDPKFNYQGTLKNFEKQN